MTNQSTPSIIVTRLPDRHVPMGPALAWAAKARGISRWRIALDIIRRMFGRQKLLPDEYFIPCHTAHDSVIGDQGVSEGSPFLSYSSSSSSSRF